MPPDPAMNQPAQPAAAVTAAAAPPAEATAAGTATPAVTTPAVASPEPASLPGAAPAPAPVSPAPSVPPAGEPATAAPASSEAGAAAKPPQPEPSLLETLGKQPEKPKEGEKPVEAKPAEAAKPEEAKPPDAAKPAEPAAVEYKYTLPETLKMDDALKGEVHKAFDDFRANPSEGAQGLINLHAKAMADFATQLDQHNRQAFADYRKSMRDKVMADPELGGAGHQTAMGAVARMRDLFVPEKDRAEFDDMLRITGAGDHPAMLRLLHNAAKWFDEPAVAPPEARPTKANGRRPNGGLYSEDSRAKMQI